ncbi:hypothetical protein RIR_jg15006.t1 [Rhizophagus irregularis DAOM 181602=DAOM 197198]|nr:hypothetical protein RIR_jg15006.t1 [Rhizophagus irregularis DAOM 181602=DAOM 197198]
MSRSNGPNGHDSLHQDILSRRGCVLNHAIFTISQIRSLPWKNWNLSLPLRGLNPHGNNDVRFKSDSYWIHFD